MSDRQTEMSHAAAKGFDLLPSTDALLILAQGQVSAATAVQHAIPQLEAAALAMAKTLQAGGNLIYAAAGSSGLMALADALELPGTYGIAPERVRMLFAGGLGDMTRMPGGPEDDPHAAQQDVLAAGVGAGDCLLAITASGSTPYALAAVEAARAAGARTIGIANNTDVPLFDLVDIAICLPTPPEVIAGSTRMGAGTAQKIALNMLSTMMAVHLGHVHDGLMVNLIADNLKLQRRAQRIVMEVTGVDAQGAMDALTQTQGAVKPAIVLAAGASSTEAAIQVLDAHEGRLRPALAAVRR